MALNNGNQPVDMMEIARRTTRRDVERVSRAAVKAVAPAKVNLVLGVGPLRADGYHPVQNVMQAVMLHDVLYLWPLADVEAAAAQAAGAAVPGTAGSTGCVTCECIAYEELPPVDAASEDNLAVRAVRALATEVFGAPDAAPGVGIRIEKHVPARAGLGGGSSDAAAALAGAAQLWQQMGACDAAQVAPEVLDRVARTLGADVPFFLRGGAAVYDDRGQNFVRQLASRKDAMVIMQPQVGLSTGLVYRTFDAMLADGAATAGDAEAAALLADATDAATLPLLNSLQAPAVQLEPQIGAMLDWCAAQPGVTACAMSGSGSAVFALCEDFGAACKLAGAAKLQGWWARTTAAAALKAAVVPA